VPAIAVQSTVHAEPAADHEDFGGAKHFLAKSEEIVDFG
jgi:hypothetical protein